MAKIDTTTKVDATGLRYKSKINGSLFGVSGASGGTMSCYKCGQHKPRSMGAYKKFMDMYRFVCGDCQTPVK